MPISQQQINRKDFLKGEGNATRVNGHYFATTALGWQTGTNLSLVLQRLKRSGGKLLSKDAFCAVYYIGLPEGSRYSIDDYRPQLPAEDVHYVGRFTL